MIANAVADLRAQVDPNADSDAASWSATATRSRSAISTAIRPGITEMDALVAYLQMLGTLVDFTSYEPRSEANMR